MDISQVKKAYNEAEALHNWPWVNQGVENYLKFTFLEALYTAYLNLSTAKRGQRVYDMLVDEIAALEITYGLIIGELPYESLITEEYEGED